MTDDPLLARVLAQAPTFPFVSLVDWLERLLQAEVDPAGRGPILLQHDPALAFHAGDHSATLRRDAAGVVVTSGFAGLTGAVSPLPTPALEAHAQDDERVEAERALLEPLQHRLLALFYRGLRAQDPARGGDDAPLLDALLALAGLPTDAGALPIARRAALQLAPLLIAHAPSAKRLVLGLTTCFGQWLAGAEAQVETLRGGWVSLSPASRPQLGRALRLGASSTLGARCRAPAAAIALILAPLSAPLLLALRPGGVLAAPLAQVIRLLVPPGVAVHVTLRAATVPPAQLGAIRLRSAWLGRGEHPEEVRHTLD